MLMKSVLLLSISFFLPACSGALRSSTLPDGAGDAGAARSELSTASDGSTATDGSTASDSVGGSADTRADSLSPDSSPSTGCGVARESGFTCFDVQFESKTRRWCMNVPQSYDSKRPYGLIIGLHGCGGNATNVHNHRANMQAYGQSDFLFTYPQAEASCWSFSDIAFVEHVVSTITTDYCLNNGRVFVHGMSSGGSMASWVAGAAVVKAFASVSAGGTARALPAWYYGGTSDSYYSLIVQSKDRQVANNGCDGTSTPIPNTPCVSYNSCTHAVTYCEDDRGHVWPQEVWAQEGMIDFFRAVP